MTQLTFAQQRKLLLLSSLGGVLEFYDFIIYVLSANYLAHVFFPASNAFINLMFTFATFALGYLVRPIGGVIFGHFGDRWGRKVTFSLSIFLMAFATFSIGLIPAYATIGLTASILITVLRIIQGLSVGGEIPGAIAYVSESLPGRKGLACGVLFCSLLMGIVLGFLVNAVLASIFTTAQIQNFGWRFPFLIGGILGLISYFFRRQLHESQAFLKIEKQVERFPTATVLKVELKHALVGTFIIGLCAATISGLFLFLPTYFSKVLHISAATDIWQRTAAMAIASCLCIVFGFLADFFNTKKLILCLSVLTVLLAYPIFAIYVYYPQYYMIALLASAFLTGFGCGVIPALLSELFSTKIRYSGIAVSYNLGFAIFAGLTPLISLALIFYTGFLTIPAAYLMVIATMAFVSLFFIWQSSSRF